MAMKKATTSPANRPQRRLDVSLGAPERGQAELGQRILEARRS
jgi:hypothetical protein